MNISWLDVKLGIRMLTRYPWLSSVAVIGMALAIAYHPLESLRSIP